MFETTSQFFCKLCITLQCHERYFFCTFLAETVHDLDKRSPSEKLCLMTLKSDAKFEENLIFCFKNDKNFVNFDPSTQKSQKSAL